MSDWHFIVKRLSSVGVLLCFEQLAVADGSFVFFGRYKLFAGRFVIGKSNEGNQ
jgi:hypothetical protein